MKRVLFGFLVATMLMLAACGTSNTAGEATRPIPVDQKTLTKQDVLNMLRDCSIVTYPTNVPPSANGQITGTQACEAIRKTCVLAENAFNDGDTTFIAECSVGIPPNALRAICCSP